MLDEEYRVEWSSKDLIEEELLKNATAESICGWLKAHADENFCALNSNFPKLREKYEPIWSADENSACLMLITALVRRESQRAPRNLWRALAVAGSSRAWS